MSIVFDPNTPELKEAPYVYMNRIRDQASILPSLGKGVHVVTSYAHVKGLMTDSDLSVRYIPKHIDLLATTDIPCIKSLGELAIVFTDPPEHQRLRKLHLNVFNSKVIDSFLPVIKGDVKNVLSKLAINKSIDVVDSLADQIPRQVLSHLLGIPKKYQDEIIETLLNVRGLLEPALLTPRKLKRLEAEFACCKNLFHEIIAQYREEPDRNLISLLIEGDKKGDGLSDEELAITCTLTFIAGHETTKGLISSAAKLFAEAPEQWDLLKKNRSLIRPAIDEIARFEPPLHFTTRLATHDFDLDSYQVYESDLILLCLASANRDPSIFENPDVFNILRENHKNVSFGLGMHNCIGKHLAHTELTTLFESMLDLNVRFYKDGEYAEVWSDQGATTRSLEKLCLCIGNP